MAVAPPGGWIYGVQLPVQTLTSTLADPWEESASVADLVTVAQKAEATGHSFIGVCDHVAIPDDDYAAPMRTTWYDTVATLGFLAAHTSTVRLVSLVWIPAYRHPLQTASSFGTLDHLSGGRVILGMGAGHVEGEFRALGIPFHERGAIFDEALEALAGVWDGTYVSFEGAHFAYTDVAVAPPPLHRRLPLWIGGTGRTAWRRVGRYADGFIPMVNSLAQYGEIIDTIRASADAAGRGDVAFDIGFRPSWAHLTGGRQTDFPPGTVFDADVLAAEIRGALAARANVLHLKFRGRSLAEYLEQYDAFREVVLPLVD